MDYYFLMTDNYPCPVCLKPMQSYAHNNILNCTNVKGRYCHATYYLNGPDIIFKIIALSSYLFYINCDQNTTTIRQEHSTTRVIELVLTLNHALELPWHDKNQVINKIKTYLV